MAAKGSTTGQAKVRVYELSKELGLSNKEVLAMLKKDFGIELKSHSSSVDQDVADKILGKASGKSKTEEKPATKAKAVAKAKEQPIKKAVIQKEKSTENKVASEQSKKSVEKPTPKKADAPPKEEPKIHTRSKPMPENVVAEEKPAPTQTEEDKELAAIEKELAELEAQETEDAEEEAPKKHVKFADSMTLAELAKVLEMQDTELIKHLFMKGSMVTINQTIQVEDCVAIADELGFDAEGPDRGVEVDQYTAPEVQIKETKGKNLTSRAPVVSIMGHVDHGKTTLLDAIRESRQNIVDTEAGGITQSIGAYSVEKNGQRIVFLDTPGHEAFTAMRMRGAQSTDIAIIVVAADDGLMPQTKEAINHAKAANIPIIVAVNKIDKAGADPDNVLVQLSEHGLNAEKWGGETLTVEVSALKRQGIDDILDSILLVSELQELKADPNLPGEGVVIESQLDRGKGSLATVLVQNGTLRVGDNILIGQVGGRVRALISDAGERLQVAGPSTPVEVLGLNGVPSSGDTFEVIGREKNLKKEMEANQAREKEQRQIKVAASGLMTDAETQRKHCYLIIKADSHGSVEAISASVLDLATEDVIIHILHAATGDVSEADVLLASANLATIVAFNVREEANVSRIAKDQGIPIRHYDIIYKLLEDLEKLVLGMLTPLTEEEETGEIEVRQLFSFGKTTIAGCYVTQGKATRNAIARVFREGEEIFHGTLDNLKRFKEDAKEVASGYECGVSFDKFNDLQEGDVIRVYTIKEIIRTTL